MSTQTKTASDWDALRGIERPEPDPADWRRVKEAEILAEFGLPLGFVPDTDEAAEQAMKIMAGLKSQADAIVLRAEAEAAAKDTEARELRDCADKMARPYREKLDILLTYCQGPLKTWATVKKHFYDHQTVPTLYGLLVFRANAQRFRVKDDRIDDKRKLGAWAADFAPEAIKATFDLSKIKNDPDLLDRCAQLVQEFKAACPDAVDIIGMAASLNECLELRECQSEPDGHGEVRSTGAVYLRDTFEQLPADMVEILPEESFSVQPGAHIEIEQSKKGGKKK